jgi:hypothetical protein
MRRALKVLEGYRSNGRGHIKLGVETIQHTLKSYPPMNKSEKPYLYYERLLRQHSLDKAFVLHSKIFAMTIDCLGYDLQKMRSGCLEKINKNFNNAVSRFQDLIK